MDRFRGRRGSPRQVRRRGHGFGRRQQKRSGGLGRLFAVLAALLLIPLAPSVAGAAGESLNISVQAVSDSILSGEAAAFRVQWACSGSGSGGAAGSCENGELRVPVPTAMPGSTAFPDGIPLTVTSQSPLQVGGQTISGSATIEGSGADRVLVWRFPGSVPTGASGTVSFALGVPNSVTPDGSTVTPEAAFSADGLASVVASASTNVESSLSLDVRKYRGFPTDVPYVNQQVTYEIFFGYDDQFQDDDRQSYRRRLIDVCADNGVRALEDLVVTDTLMPGAQFVSATFGGVHDSATNTVTWNLGGMVSDQAPFTCLSGAGENGWRAWSPLEVTVVYPDDTFSATASPDIENQVKVEAAAWGEPSERLEAQDSTAHGLREGSTGGAVGKRSGFNATKSRLQPRTYDSSVNHRFELSMRSEESVPGVWRVVDMLPCPFVSPTDPNDFECETPALTNIRFAAAALLPELKIHWTTNAGTTGVCTIAAGTSLSDSAKRFCDGGTSSTPIAGVPAGEWISKFEFEAEIEPFGGGSVYLYGRTSEGVPYDNVDVVYNQNPAPGTDRSDEHPWFVTVENCTAENVLAFDNGRSYRPVTPQGPGANGGLCGYQQVSTEPASLRPVKRIFDPAIPAGNRPVVPSAQPGDSLRVELETWRSTWEGFARGGDQQRHTFTPVVTELLPPQMILDADSVVIQGDPVFVNALGEPMITVDEVEVGGELRQRLSVSFPNAEVTSDSSMEWRAIVAFDVTVTPGSRAGAYTNQYVLGAEEAGVGSVDPYLVCVQGSLVDADYVPTGDFREAIGCLVAADFIVLPTPGVSVAKSVQGSLDDQLLPAPGVGLTDAYGEVRYDVEVRNSGSVAIDGAVVYDLLPAVGDTDILPGSNVARGSEFAVLLTGPVTAPAGADVRYSSSAQPCRGDLAGAGGGPVASAPAGCVDDWSASPAGGDWSSVRGIRVDFGSRRFEPGERDHIVIDARVDAGEDQVDERAWNNVAAFAEESSSGRPVLPTEASKVGIEVFVEPPVDTTTTTEATTTTTEPEPTTTTTEATTSTTEATTSTTEPTTSTEATTSTTEAATDPTDATSSTTEAEETTTSSVLGDSITSDPPASSSTPPKGGTSTPPPGSSGRPPAAGSPGVLSRTGAAIWRPLLIGTGLVAFGAGLIRTRRRLAHR